MYIIIAYGPLLNASDSVVFLQHCALYELYLLTYLFDVFHVNSS